MENLKKLRQQKGLSQQKLADILHISQQSFYKYKNDLIEKYQHLSPKRRSVIHSVIDSYFEKY